MPASCSGLILMTERRFNRVLDLLGEKTHNRLMKTRITVIGLGGVGCHAAIALARCGAGALKLVDFDLLTETSLNRNPIAGLSDIGEPKVEILASQLRRTCPNTEIETLVEFFHEDTAAKILAPPPDIVVDAIDSLNPKVALLEYCIRNNISVVSSMGASGRRDPSLVRRGDISQTSNCPLAKQLRKYLRKRGISKGIQCVYSVESAGKHALPPDTDDQTLERGRIRNSIPSLITMPGIFGYALADLVLEFIEE